MKILDDQDGQGVSIFLDQSRKTPTIFMGSGAARTIKSAIEDGCTMLFVNTRDDAEGRPRVILSFRKPSERSQGRPDGQQQ